MLTLKIDGIKVMSASTPAIAMDRAHWLATTRDCTVEIYSGPFLIVWVDRHTPAPSAATFEEAMSVFAG